MKIKIIIFICIFKMVDVGKIYLVDLFDEKFESGGIYFLMFFVLNNVYNFC